MTLPKALALAFCLAPLAASPVCGQDSTATAAGRSVLDSVYSEAQAVRGERVLRTVCSVCHQESYFRRSAFHEPWVDQPVYFLFRDILTRMPDDSPGILSRREVADALAYILRLNGFPAGETELSTEDDPLREIVWKAPPGGDR